MIPKKSIIRIYILVNPGTGTLSWLGPQGILWSVRSFQYFSSLTQRKRKTLFEILKIMYRVPFTRILFRSKFRRGMKLYPLFKKNFYSGMEDHAVNIFRISVVYFKPFTSSFYSFSREVYVLAIAVIMLPIILLMAGRWIILVVNRSLLELQESYIQFSSIPSNSRIQRDRMDSRWSFGCSKRNYLGSCKFWY